MKEMGMKVAVVLGLVGLIGTASAVVGWVVVEVQSQSIQRAQGHTPGKVMAPESVPPKQWEVGQIEYRNWNNARVDVIETAGVCLYVAIYLEGAPAIAAVPKSLLRAGEGCQ